MLPLPQHPIHYLLGSITHAPYVFEAWVHERIEIKKALFLFYAYSFIGIGLIMPGVGMLDFFGIYVMVAGIMSIPTYIFSNKQPFLIKVSNSFFNGVLAYHAFFVFFFIAYNASIISSGFFDGWTPNRNSVTMGLGMMMLSGFSLQMAWTNSKGFPWTMVWLFSLIIGVLAYWGFLSAF